MQEQKLSGYSYMFFNQNNCVEGQGENNFEQFTEAVVWRCFVEKVFLEILQNSQENTCARASFLIKLQTSACNFIKKETLAQVFSCEFCEISKNIFFYRTPPVAASECNLHISQHFC